jgi:autotransporter passenger strand-loop-strand repeat protein
MHPHLLSGAVFEVGSGALTSVTNESGVTVKVLSGGVVSGGTTLFHNVVTALNGGVVSNLTIRSGGGLTVSAGGVASGSTILSGGTELIASGGTDLGISFVSSGGLLETAIGGTALLSGAVVNSGTLFASGANSLIDVINGATVTGGGIAKIANGILNIEGSGDNQNVVFQSAGTGTLEISDAPGNTSAFGGTVSGFGQNVHQFINLTSVHFVSGVVSARYSSSTANSGVLTVTSGGSANVVAVIDLSGHYVTSNFSHYFRQQRHGGDFRSAGGGATNNLRLSSNAWLHRKNCRNRHRRHLGRQVCAALQLHGIGICQHDRWPCRHVAHGAAANGAIAGPDSPACTMSDYTPPRGGERYSSARGAERYSGARACRCGRASFAGQRLVSSLP